MKGKEKASQKAVVAPTGQVDQVDWKCALERGKRKDNSLFQGLFKLPIICG
jgi:hypothetical protein